MKRLPKYTSAKKTTKKYTADERKRIAACVNRHGPKGLYQLAKDLRRDYSALRKYAKKDMKRTRDVDERAIVKAYEKLRRKRKIGRVPATQVAREVGCCARTVRLVLGERPFEERKNAANRK